MTAQAAPAANGVHWLTRAVSLLVNGVMGLILTLALTNEDPMTPQGWPVAIAVMVCLATSLLSWRRAALGGWLTVLGALGLAAAVIYSATRTGLGLEGVIIATLIYPVPYFILAGLSLMDATVRAGLR